MAAGSFGDDSGYEVAIAGRSNSGKSSALNAIVRNQGLARTSRTPGRTQAVNMFELEPGRRIVDLPGYGHANVPAAVRAAWARLMDAYFAERESLSGLLIVVDARRGFGESDEAMLAYALARGIPSHVLLSKADKLGRNDHAGAGDGAQGAGRARGCADVLGRIGRRRQWRAGRARGDADTVTKKRPAIHKDRRADTRLGDAIRVTRSGREAGSVSRRSIV